MKKDRQNTILTIIASNDIETQSQLIAELAKTGIEITQATVSRDIKELRLIKELTPGGVSKYAASDRPDANGHMARLKAVFKEYVTFYTNAQNIVVIKTAPGFAPNARIAIDAIGSDSLVGSIAGDDTCFLAMTDIAAAENFCKEIEDILNVKTSPH